MSFTELLIQYIQEFGMWAVVAGVAVETIIVPLPSPIILMAAGALLVSPGSWVSIVVSIFWISLVAGIAQTIGSYLVYGLAYWLGESFITKFERFHGVSWEDIERFQKKFEGRKEELTLFALRALPIMPLSVVSGVAGIIKMRPRQYTLGTFAGVVPRNMMLAAGGFIFREAYEEMAKHVDSAESIMTIFIVLLLVFYVVAQKTGFIEKLRKKIL